MKQTKHLSITLSLPVITHSFISPSLPLFQCCVLASSPKDEHLHLNIYGVHRLCQEPVQQQTKQTIARPLISPCSCIVFWTPSLVRTLCCPFIGCPLPLASYLAGRGHDMTFVSTHTHTHVHTRSNFGVRLKLHNVLHFPCCMPWIHDRESTWM